ncbi:PREDICTED: SH3 and cysteine-rich domain-containing protein-like, partial [Buceros rhinoceros silvestris]|uniref:SH3 and cysteine-rich domain-containing protein-like n=1 Tax=Buceros rhinoceros silvestris TaxID=175836 RepID=UPI00052850CC
MIPPSSTTEVSVDSVEKENEVEQPPSPASTTSQESKLQKLKRSLSFKTKSLRSKSADNFFQRTNSDVKLQVDLMPEVSTSTGQLPSSESQASSPTRAPQLPENNKAHIFQEHIFKKPTFCDVCNHMIVGDTKHQAQALLYFTLETAEIHFAKSQKIFTLQIIYGTVQGRSEEKWWPVAGGVEHAWSPLGEAAGAAMQKSGPRNSHGCGWLVMYMVWCSCYLSSSCPSAVDEEEIQCPCTSMK